jgi:hypothetical protein
MNRFYKYYKDELLPEIYNYFLNNEYDAKEGQLQILPISKDELIKLLEDKIFKLEYKYRYRYENIKFFYKFMYIPTNIWTYYKGQYISIKPRQNWDMGYTNRLQNIRFIDRLLLYYIIYKNKEKAIIIKLIFDKYMHKNLINLIIEYI